MKTNKNNTMKQSFIESINWEWVHAHHTGADGKIGPGPWCDKIIAHARRNGFAGKITPRGACRLINSMLW